MRYTVTVKPNAKVDAVEERGEKELLVRVKAPAKEGKANDAVVRLLANHVGVPQSSVTILSGARGKKKIIEIP